MLQVLLQLVDGRLDAGRAPLHGGAAGDKLRVQAGQLAVLAHGDAGRVDLGHEGAGGLHQGVLVLALAPLAQRTSRARELDLQVQEATTGAALLAPVGDLLADDGRAARGADALAEVLALAADRQALLGDLAVNSQGRGHEIRW